MAYTDCPLVQLLDHQLAKVWPRCPISGSPGFAASGDRVLFSGGYKKRESVFEVDLKSLRSREFLPVDEKKAMFAVEWRSRLGRIERVHIALTTLILT